MILFLIDDNVIIILHKFFFFTQKKKNVFAGRPKPEIENLFCKNKLLKVKVENIYLLLQYLFIVVLNVKFI